MAREANYKLSHPGRDAIKFKPPAPVESSIIPPHTIAPAALPYGNPLIFHGPRLLDVDPSIIHQIDGLCSSLFALRPERDIGARSATDSYTHLWGLGPHLSLSVAPGLYLADMVHSPRMVAAAAADQAVGVFVVPVRPGASPCLTDAKGHSLGPCNWYDHLMVHAVFTFTIDSSSFVRRRHDGTWLPWIPPFGVVAVLANFGRSWIRRSKNKYRRGLRRFHLTPLTGAAAPTTRRLPVVPSLLRRPHPLHEELRPNPSADTSPACDPPPFEFPPGFQIPPSPLNAVQFARETADYPFPLVRRVALEAITGTLQPFVGDLEKSTLIPAERELRSEEHVLRARGCLVKNVAKRLTAGPFAKSPCPKARLCPVATVVKSSHDEDPKESWEETRARAAAAATAAAAEPKYRLISMFDTYGTSSVNDLCWSPLWVSRHLSAAHLRDRVASMPCGTQWSMWDIVGVFKLLALNPALLHLFVYRLESEKFGVEYFADLTFPFGWRPSEYGWAAVAELILWRLVKQDVIPHMNAIFLYVDNFFFPHTSLGATEVRKMDAVLETALTAMGLPLHEHYCGTFFRGSGWLFDTANKMIKCPLEKFVRYLEFLRHCLSGPYLSLLEIEILAGILQWLSLAFPIVRADLPLLSPLRKEGHAKIQRTGLSRSRVILSTKSIHWLISFWFHRFKAWNRLCPIVQGFGPTVGAQVLGRTDASKWGCGGLFFDVETRRLVLFVQPWAKSDIAKATAGLQALSAPQLETLGLLRWFQLFGERSANRRTRVSTDSETAVLACDDGFSKQANMHAYIREIFTIAAENHIALRIGHILGERFNKIADLLSRGAIDSALCRARLEFDAVPRLLRLDPAT